MNKKKLTAITLSLAAAAVSATLGGALLGKGVTSADDVTSYALTKVFSTANAATIGADATTSSQTAITLPDDASVSFKNHLAYKWYTGKDTPKYLSIKFKFTDTSFASVALDFDAPSAWATKDDKTTNTVKFEKSGNDLKVKINDTEIGTIAEAVSKSEITLTLGEGTKDGEFTVNIKAGNREANGKFENVGANYVTQSSSMTPFKISADFLANSADDAKTVVHLVEINGQAFNNLNDKGEVPDTAAPVFVVNEAIDGFILGTAFDLEYDVIDVLKKDSLTETLSYYQYDYSKGKEYEPSDSDYKTLDTSVYFMEKRFDKDGKATSMYRKGNELFESVSTAENIGKAEYFSIKAKLGDGENTNPIDLSWYVKDGARGKIANTYYIPVDRNEDGAEYKGIEVTGRETKDDKTDDKTVVALKVVENLLVDVASYQNKETALNEIKAKLEINPEYKGDANAFKEDYADFVYNLLKEAASVSAGSNSKVNIPSVKWLISDNNGYRNLNFTICYKTPASETKSSSKALSHSQLKLSVANEGLYEFKIFAVDEANNEMKYFDKDGKLVSVNEDTIWEIEEIPAFSFQIKKTGMKIENPEKASSKKETVILNKTYTLDDFDVTGADEATLKKEYALYKVDLSKFSKDDKKISQSNLTAISYEDLTKKMDATKVTDGDYLTAYLKAYATLLAENIGVEATDETVKAIMDNCFERIGEADDRKNGKMDDEGNYVYAAYNWVSANKSFETVEEGTYMILADYYESELPTNRAAAFKIVVVESEADYVKGETEWLKNNIVSVILFAIAGVMLILIIILLLVKPSDETLDDVDAKAAVKKEKTKKSKK